MNEIWKDIKYYEGLYQISSLGKVKSLKRKGCIKERILKCAKTSNGYLCVVLCKNNKSKTFSVHRLVALHFIPNLENKLCINHKDGIKTNNNIENLEWATHSENNIHSFAHGLQNTKGENNFNAKLTKENVVVIKKLLEENILPKKIANQFNVSHVTIYSIKNNKTWRDNI